MPVSQQEYGAIAMDLRRALNEHMNASQDLLQRLRSIERATLTEVDLVLVTGHLFRLDCEGATLGEAIRHFQKKQRELSRPFQVKKRGSTKPSLPHEPRPLSNLPRSRGQLKAVGG